MAVAKEALKHILGEIPFTAELYYLVRQNGRPIQSRFSLKHLQTAMPELVEQATELRRTAKLGKKVAMFSTLHYWIEHAALLGLALAAQGHQVSFGFLPYAEWQSQINKFDLRRQNAYAKRVLSMASPLIDSTSLLSIRTSSPRSKVI